jgi:hypothetical protein
LPWQPVESGPSDQFVDRGGVFIELFRSSGQGLPEAVARSA